MVRSTCYRRRALLDLGKCRKPDYRGHRYFFVGKDDYSESGEFGTMKSKTPQDTWDAVYEKYPGTCLQTREDDPDSKFPFEWSVDGGDEFGSVFAKNTKDRGGRLRISLPGRSKSNAKAEKAVGDVQRDVAPAMGCGNAPGSWWSLAAEMQMYNNERTKLVRDTGKTRYELRRGVPWSGTLYPFCCAAPTSWIRRSGTSSTADRGTASSSATPGAAQ